MVNGIRTYDPCGLDKRHGLKFRIGSQVRQTPERCEYNNKDEDNSWKILNEKNQASSQKFKQLFFMDLLLFKWILP